MVIATGFYLGEGFDWPELDTLFLACPTAFRGRLVQYVGRLLRAHGTKLDVELHDYLDEDVPVLARMRAKRLPAYKTLGFDTHRRVCPTRRRSLSPHQEMEPDYPEVDIPTEGVALLVFCKWHPAPCSGNKR